MSAAPPIAVMQRLQQALLSLQQGQHAAARADCEQALALDPRSADGWRLHGIACEGLGDAEAALASFARVLELHPQSGQALYEFGDALLKAGRAQEALPQLQQAVDRLPQDVGATFALGRTYLALGRHREACAALSRAVERAPAHADAWNALAAARLKLGEVPAALEAARQAVALRPTSPRSQHTLAAALSWTFERAGLEEGLQYARHALAAMPQDAEAHHTAALLLRKLDDPAASAVHAGEALRLAPDSATYAITLGEVLQRAGRAEEAARVYTDALAAHPQHAALHRQRGIARLQRAQAPGARDDLRIALAQAPDDQRAIAHLGVALAATGDLAAAAALLGLERHVHAMQLAPPEGFSDADAFHHALAEDIRNHSQQRWEPAGLAARRGYLSGDLLADRTPAIGGFERRLREAIDRFIAGLRPDPDDPFLHPGVLEAVARRYELHVWATRVAEAGNIDTHIHEESWLSGAYYVELPPAIRDDDPTHAGWIEFGRPHGGLPAWPESALRRVRPRVGTLLLFPSYFFHRTLPYRGAGERISISFDLAAN